MGTGVPGKGKTLLATCRPSARHTGADTPPSARAGSPSSARLPSCGFARQSPVLLPPRGSASPFPYAALGSGLEMVQREPLRRRLIFAGSLPRCRRKRGGSARRRQERAGQGFHLLEKKKKRGSEPEGGTCGRAALARASPGGIRRAALVPGFQGHFNPVCWLLERSHRRGCWRGTAGPERRCQERGRRSRRGGRDSVSPPGPRAPGVWPRAASLDPPPGSLPREPAVPGALHPAGRSRGESQGLGPRITPSTRETGFCWAPL